MTQEQFIARWEGERSIYAAWGDTVLTTILSGLEALPCEIETFLKTEAKPRIKANQSLLDKAFARGKNYTDPYEEITDKIGVRFVVLLTDHIKAIEQIILTNDLWNFSKDRDYEAERDLRPLEFSYQSVHYVLRARNDVGHGTHTIPAGTPCEVQIRTLLQHAHCELTHDTTYKPKELATPKVKRIVAKSMALIEAADDFFVEVFKNLEGTASKTNSTLSMLTSIYKAQVGLEPENSKSNLLIIDALNSILPEDLNTAITRFLSSKGFVLEQIKQNYAANHLFRQPSILLAYWGSEISPAQTKALWPLAENELRGIFTGMGKSFANF